MAEDAVRFSEEEALRAIIGSQLSSVEFVQTYLQLRFDGPCLTTFVCPIVVQRDHRLRPTDAEYCNALRRSISHRVTSVAVRIGDAIEIDLDDGTAILVSLAPEGYTAGPEAAMFVNDQHWWVL